MLLLLLDITLSKVNHLVVDFSKIQIIKKLGVGSNSVVSYGTVRKVELAVKQFKEYHNQSTFGEFRKEVS